MPSGDQVGFSSSAALVVSLLTASSLELHDVELAVPVPAADEGDPARVRRPGGVEVVGGVARYPGDSAAVGVGHVDLRVAVPHGRERDPRPVGGHDRLVLDRVARRDSARSRAVGRDGEQLLALQERGMRELAVARSRRAGARDRRGRDRRDQRGEAERQRPASSCASRRARPVHGRNDPAYRSRIAQALGAPLAPAHERGRASFGSAALRRALSASLRRARWPSVARTAPSSSASSRAGPGRLLLCGEHRIPGQPEVVRHARA